MPGSRASVFGEAEDFQAALSRGRRCQGAGHRRRPIPGATDPTRARALAAGGCRGGASTDCVYRGACGHCPGRVSDRRRTIAGLGRVEIRTGEMITLGSGQRLHARTAGPSHWAAVQVLEQQLADYGRVLSGTRFAVPSVARWRPPRAAARQLRDLHRAAMRMAEACAGALTDPQAAHGLEQQLLHALIECLSEEPEEETATGRRHRDLVARFEDLLVAQPFLPIAEICTALGVSDRALRECCKRHLGMRPSRYRRLRAMQQVHRALRSGASGAASVSEVARRHGFRGLGRLAANYRALYGELPSVTLWKGLSQELTRLAARRRRGRA
jgi:AraC-like DNA-binding protein